MGTVEDSAWKLISIGGKSTGRCKTQQNNFYQQRMGMERLKLEEYSLMPTDCK